MNLRKTLFLIIFSFVLPIPLGSRHQQGIALAEVQIPAAPMPVIDDADWLSESEKAEISRYLIQMRQAKGPHMTVWLIKTLEGEDIAALGIRAAESWQLGSSAKDDGLILIVARQDRKYRLEVGQGLEGEIPDAISRRILDRILRRYLRQGQVAEGVYAVVSEIANITNSQPAGASARPVESSTRGKGSLFGSLFNLLIFGLFFVAVVISRIHSAIFGRRRYYGGHYSGSWRGGGWGRGGGSSWGGGGGGFSGGGSSGSW